MTEHQPKSFPILRYFFGIWYIWYMGSISNGEWILISAFWFGIAFGFIDILKEQQ